MSITSRAFGIGSLLLLGGAAVTIACEESSTPAVGAADAAAESAADGAPDVVASDANDGATTSCTSLPGSYGSKGCNDCMLVTCCEVITKCEDDPACKPLQKCLLDCLQGPDAGACYSKCMIDYPDGKKNWDPVEACWFNDPPKCGVVCT